MENLLRMKNITKEFPGVLAVDNVDLTLNAGEVLALMGENGAGKSTLIKILAGAHQADKGEIVVAGKPYKNYSTKEAIDLGIGIIYQELNYLNDLTIAENILLGQVPLKGPFKRIDYKGMFEEARKILDRVGLNNREPNEFVRSLSIAEKQLVEIARALSRDAKIIVMDEPTSALNEVETENLFKLIKQMKQEGKGIIYISHRMEEIFAVSDRTQVMRDGKAVKELITIQTSKEEIVKYMVGREIKDMYPSRNGKIGDVVFSIKNLNTDYLKDISLTVRSGEVVGLFGLMGSGRTEIARCIVGTQQPKSGVFNILGNEYTSQQPIDALKRGISYIPAERKSEGVNLTATVKENITISNLKKIKSGLVLNLKKEKEHAAGWVKKLNIKTPSINAETETLSGGNQQKVVVAKCLNTDPKFLIMNEPTRGIDVGAKVEIYNIINQLCMDKHAVLMISSELPEIMAMCDRMYVLHEGKVTAEIEKNDCTQEKLLEFAIGE